MLLEVCTFDSGPLIFTFVNDIVMIDGEEQCSNDSCVCGALVAENKLWDTDLSAAGERVGPVLACAARPDVLMPKEHEHHNASNENNIIFDKI